MDEKLDKAEGRTVAEAFRIRKYRFTPGKWILLAVAGLMVVGGIVLALAAPAPEPAGTSAASRSGGAKSGSGSGLVNSLTDGGGTGWRVPGVEPAEPARTTDGSWRDFSPAMIRGGFGMFVGFAIGFAIRSFLRLAMVVVGFYLLTLTLMAWAGWVEIHWDVMETQFNGLVANLGAQFESFKAFLTGSLPSAGMTAAGLTTGLRQR